MMKKVFALLCVCVMAMAMAVPTFAATQGQVDDLAAQLDKNPGNYNTAKELTNIVNSDKGLVVDEKATNVMKNFLVSYNGNVPSVEKTVDGCKVSAYHSPAVGQPLDISKVSFKDNTLEITAQFAGGVQSELGTYVEVEMNTPIDSSKSYMWECDGQTGRAIVSTFGSGDSAYSTVSFYAPHFSTYVISVVNSETPAPEAAPAPTVLANTGADMSFAILGIVGLGALAVLGSALALKKRGAKN